MDQDSQREREHAGGSIDGVTWLRVVGVMERLAASRDLDEILQLVIDAMRDLLGADRASVLQYDHATHELFATRAHGLDSSIRFSADAGIAGESLKKREVVLIPDCYADARFNRDVDQRTGYRTRCLLTVPLVSHDGGVEGVVQALNKRDGGNGAAGLFCDRDVSVARAMASQAAVAIRRARLLEAERLKDELEATLRIARQMQEATLPSEMPEVAGYTFAGRAVPADQTGGDTFDLFLVSSLDARSLGLDVTCGSVGGSGGVGGGGGGGGVLALLADATGHGVGPALSATQLHAMVRMGVSLGTPVEELVRRCNSLMRRTLPLGRFITGFFGVLDPAKHELVYRSAGQGPILIVRASGEVDVRHADAAPLGIDDEMEISAAEPVRFGVGDVVCVPSDGLTECVNGEGVQLDSGPIIDVIRETASRGAPAVLEAVFALTDRHRGATPAGDDRTAIVIHRAG